QLAEEHSFIAAVLAAMTFPTGQTPATAFPLTIYSPIEVPLMEKDNNGNDVGPAKIVRRSSASLSSDPAGFSPDSGASAGASAGSGDPQAKNPNKKNRKKKSGPGANLVAAIARGVPGSHSAPAPALPVGPPPKKPRSEMAQSDLPI
ncbi:hypothetical protein PMAYCL1PPCAC_09057, partial [Pristionchus mayeri]